jgi:hypothetical protein
VRAALAGHREAVLATGVGIVAALTVLVRTPAQWWDVAWAEDANVFLLEGVERGPWTVLFTGYAGYQHVVPRVGSAVALAVAPLEGYAVACLVVSALVTGAVGSGVYLLSRQVVPFVAARVVLGLLPVLLPLAGQEVLGNLANLHTVLLWLLLWVVFWEPRSRITARVGAVVALLCALSEVQFLILLVPAFILLRQGWRRRLPIVVAMLIGGAAQLATVVTVERDARPAWIGLDSLLQGWLINTVLPLLNADPGSLMHWLQTTGLVIPTLLTVPFLLAFAVALWRGDPRQRILAVTLLALSLGLYAAGALADGSELYRYAEPGAAIWERGVNSRYGGMSGMCLAALVPLAAAVLLWDSRFRMPRATRRAVAWVAVAGLAATFLVAGTRSVTARHDVDALWSPSVAEMARGCAGLDADAPIPLAVAPARLVFLTCGQITRYAEADDS